MAKALYIIGNGFDLYHGLDTRYQSFAFYLQKHHSEIYDLLVEYFGLPDLDPSDENSHKDPLWADFENALANLDFQTVLDDNTTYLANPGSPDFRDREWHAYQIEMEMIVDKLTKALRKAFKEFILAVEFPEPTDHKLLALESGAFFLNFNYTDTLEKYYHIQWKRILYIHGKAILPDENIVLGHSRHPEEFKEDEIKEPEGLSPDELDQWREHMSNQYDFSFESGKQQLMSYFNDSFKSTSEIIEKRKPIFNSLLGTNQVFVLGHSLAPVDQPYFKQVIQSINDNSITWTITYYHNDERESHLNTLRTLGLREDELNLVRMEVLQRVLPSLF